MKKYIVYMHINNINNKTYIGYTSKTPYIRWGKDGYGYRKQYLYNDIQEYGWDNFEHIILFENKTKEEAEYLETLFTKILLSNDSEFGYNVTIGEYFKNRGESPHAKKIICDGKIFDCIKDCADYYNVSYSLMRMWLKGKNTMPEIFYNKGLNYLENPKVMKVRSNITLSYNPVICDNITFNSMNDCADFYNVHSSTISNWLYKRTQMPENFIKMGLRFVNNEEAINKKVKNKYKKLKSKKVICDNTLFNSIKDCADYYGIKCYTMGAWLRGICNMRKEFTDLGLRYATEEDLGIYKNA